MHGDTATASHVARSHHPLPSCLSSATTSQTTTRARTGEANILATGMAVATARWLLLLLAISAAAAAAANERWRQSSAVGGQVVEKERRRVVAASEAGTVTAVDVADAAGTVYRLHFITMDPGALFLPVQLLADMVFYVHSGRGKITYIEEGSSEQSSLAVERGDVYNLEQGTILYIQSYPNATRQRLRIYAIFTSEGINADDPSKPTVEAYSSVSNLLKGFEIEVLRLGFGVQREVAEAIKSSRTPPSIIPYNPEEKEDQENSNWKEDIVDALLRVRDPEEFLNKKKDKHKHKGKDKKSKSKTFNFYSGKPDVQNCYGWSRSMTNKDLDTLHGSNIGMFMVNLTTGSMMGPHWNPKATEIAIVTDGEGIVQTVCPSSSLSGESRGGHRGHEWGEPGGRGDEDEGARCRNSVFRVQEGDVFVVPRFHPLAQMSFNNDSFVFVGFSTDMGQNHPQFLAGKQSVLHAIGKEVLALSLGQENSSAVEQLLSAQRDSTILSCISCAEELDQKAAEEERRRREEEEGGGTGPGEREEEERREQEERGRKEREEKQEREEEERARREQEEQQRREKEERAKRGQEKQQRQGEEETEHKEQQRRKQEERAKREKEKQQREEEEREHEERQREKEEWARRQQNEEERARRKEERRQREEEEGGGGGGDEPEREEEGEGGDDRLSKKLKKLYRVSKGGVFSSG
ncbi:vicilin-like seed storage protein At2g18540 [Phragmites australis]|uniref:vicilin-like seed storage protein At2g18540 n=1 Tax=Phragmites australis TaxID=29695 RepID=UPI002D79CE8A|nr:vicilin-like seed storage protein At2g18540 [Phragmites australis]